VERERAMVKFFDARDGKKFGFLKVVKDGELTGEELFFHNGDLRFVDIDGNDIVFTGATKNTPQGEVRMREPKPDDRVYFERVLGNNGRSKASPWTYASLYEKCERELKARPVYRVVRSGRNYGQDASGVPWQGQDILDLSARYPKRSRSKDPRGTHDPLAAGSADSGDMYWHYHFEQQLADGTWKSCDDPRVENCCVPRAALRRYNPGYFQDRCFHGKDQFR